MPVEISLQLEALKLLQQWSVWLITLSTAFIGLIGFAFRDLADGKQIFAARSCIVLLLATVVLAVLLVGAIPAIMQKLQPEIADNLVGRVGNARGIYGYLYLDFVPLWLLVTAQRITFLTGLFFGCRLVWLRHRVTDAPVSQ